jgi:hypothetical protein
MDIKTYLEKKKELDSLIEKEGRSILSGFFSDFFADHPDIHAIKWTQYTPYFMDGDPCVFGLNDVHLCHKPLSDLNRDLNSWSDNPEDENGEEVDHGWLSTQSPTERAFEGQLQTLEDLCLKAFDDHAEILATRGNNSVVEFEVSEYEHD